MNSMQWRQMRFPVAVAVAAFILFTGYLFIHDSITSTYPWLNHDVSFLGLAGTRIMEGASLYRDIQEVNPPGVFYLYAGLVGISTVLGIAPFPVFNIFVLVLGTLGILLLLKTYAGPENTPRFILVTMAYVLVVVRGNFSNNIIPSSPGMPCDYGQREHLFALVFLPYVMWRISGAKPTWYACGYLVLLGYFASFKPYYIFLLLIVELYAWFRCKLQHRVSSPAAIMSGIAVPFVIMLFQSPISYKYLLQEVLPLYFSGLYSHYGLDAGSFYFSPYHLQMLAAGVLVLASGSVCLLRYRREDSAPALLLLLTASTYAAMLWQHKFWSYHGMVYFGVCMVSGSYLFAALLDRIKREVARNILCCLFLGALVAASLWSIDNMKVMLRDRQPTGHSLVPIIKGRDSVMFFSMSVDYSYAPLAAGVRTVGPWGEHYQVPVLLGIDDDEKRDEALREYCMKLRRTIIAEKPRMLLFAPYKEGLPRGVHLHDVLERYGTVPGGMYLRIQDRLLGGGNPYLRGWIVYEIVENIDDLQEDSTEKSPA